MGDTPLFSQTIGGILSALTPTPWQIQQTTYDRFGSLLSPRLFQTTSLIILDLFRTYPTDCLPRVSPWQKPWPASSSKR